GTRSFQRVDAAERAIEPARMVLRLEVRARQCLGAARLALSQNIADAVDRGLEPGRRALLGEPVARRDVFGRERRPMHAGLVGTEGTQLVEIAEEAVRLDGGHGYSLWTGGWSFRGARTEGPPEPGIHNHNPFGCGNACAIRHPSGLWIPGSRRTFGPRAPRD